MNQSCAPGLLGRHHPDLDTQRLSDPLEELNFSANSMRCLVFRKSIFILTGAPCLFHLQFMYISCYIKQLEVSDSENAECRCVEV